MERFSEKFQFDPEGELMAEVWLESQGIETTYPNPGDYCPAGNWDFVLPIQEINRLKEQQDRCLITEEYERTGKLPGSQPTEQLT